jgi:hypothetical protein
VGNVLAKISAGPVVDRLIARTGQEYPAYQRDMATVALRRLAVTGRLPTAAAADLVRLAADDTLHENARTEVLDAIRFVDSSTVIRYREELRRLGQSDAPTERHFTAMAALARHGWLHDLDPAILETHLGLSRSGTGWQLAHRTDWRGPEVVVWGILYQGNAGAFGPVIATAVRQLNDQLVYRLLPLLEGACSAIAEVIASLRDRILERTTLHHVEAPLFATLARLSVTSFLATKWELHWDRWHPQARVVLADALEGSTPVDSRDLDRLIALMRVLMGDGQYAVRRAAYRAVSRHAPEVLRELCRTWSAPTEKEVEFRLRAAEASVWLRAEPSERDGIPQLLLGLLVDAEPTVREAAVRARDEYWEMTWGQEHLDRIRHGLELGESVLSLYRYGRALAHTGDDGMERELDMFREAGEFAPHVDWWLSRVCKAVKKRWQDVTSKWPDPWVALEGTLFEFEGTIGVEDTTYPAHMTLWCSPRRTLADQGDWGGVVRPSACDGHSLVAIAFKGASILRLSVPGRASANALFSKAPVGGDGLLIEGCGPFPEPLSLVEKVISEVHGLAGDVLPELDLRHFTTKLKPALDTAEYEIVRDDRHPLTVCQQAALVSAQAASELPKVTGAEKVLWKICRLVLEYGALPPKASPAQLRTFFELAVDADPEVPRRVQDWLEDATAESRELRQNTLATNDAAEQAEPP